MNLIPPVLGVGVLTSTIYVIYQNNRMSNTFHENNERRKNVEHENLERRHLSEHTPHLNLNIHSASQTIELVARNSGPGIAEITSMTKDDVEMQDFIQIVNSVCELNASHPKYVANSDELSLITCYKNDSEWKDIIQNKLTGKYTIHYQDVISHNKKYESSIILE